MNPARDVAAAPIEPARSFGYAIGLQFGPVLRQALADLSAALAPSFPAFTPIAPDLLHLTLASIRVSDRAQLPIASAILDDLAARFAPVSLRLDRLRPFNSPMHCTCLTVVPRMRPTVSVGLTLTHHLAAAGLEPKVRRRFLPHITLFRTDAVQQLLVRDLPAITPIEDVGIGLSLFETWTQGAQVVERVVHHAVPLRGREQPTLWSVLAEHGRAIPARRASA